MAESIIGALRVLLSLDTVAFSSGVNEAGKNLNKLDGFVKNATGGLVGLKGVIAGLSAGAFVAFLKSSVKVGEEIEKASDRLGISKKAYQELTYAADVAGVSHETLTGVLGKFQKGLGQTSADLTTTQKGLGLLGLTLDDLKKKSPEEQFRLVAERIGAISDPAKRAAAEVALFGRAGAELDVIFRLGAGGLAKFADEAARFGFILSDETIKKAAEADDEFDKIGRALKVAGVNIAAEFLPAIEAVRKAFTDPAFQSGVASLASNFGSLIKILVENGVAVSAVLGAFSGARLGAVFGPIGVAIGVLGGAATGASVGFNLFTTELDKAKQALAAAKLEAADYNDQMKGLETLAASTSMSTAEQDKRMEELADGYNKAKAKIGPLTDEVNRLQESSEKLNITISKKPGDVSPFFAEIQQELKQITFQTELAKGTFDALPAGFPAIAEKFNGIKDAAGNFITKVGEISPQLMVVATQFALLNTYKLNEELLGSWDKLSEKIQKVIEQNKLLPAGSAAAAIGISNLNKLYQKQIDIQLDAVQTGVSGFAQLAGAFAKNNKSMAAAAKAFGIAEVIISTARAIMKAYAELGPVLGTVAAAGMAAAGAAQIIKISSQSFAEGGSFMVPGGSMGVDTKSMMLNLAPGEVVDVTPASQVDHGSAGGTLVISPIRSKDFFTGDTVREMVMAIDQWMRDGGTGIKLAQQR